MHSGHFSDAKSKVLHGRGFKHCFHLAVSFVGQSSLQLEKYSLCKRQRILDNYGDMRHRMACQILSLWSHLGNLKLHFIPGENI